MMMQWLPSYSVDLPSCRYIAKRSGDRVLWFGL